MKVAILYCKYCGKEFEKELKEVKRQIKKGRTDFFCGLTCAGFYNNAGKVNPIITKVCPVCEIAFEVKSGAREATFCSRSCASAGSVTEKRRSMARQVGAVNLALSQTTQSMRNAVYSKESWKYAKLVVLLDLLNSNYEFEYILGNFIYDLALLDKRTLIEFDGDDHTALGDAPKNAFALESGWQLYRIPVTANTLIEGNLLLPYL